jgi:hypothetical protein
MCKIERATMGSKGRIELAVELEGRADEVLVVVDQRDNARWEVQPFRDDEAVFLRLRFLAWSAMVRQGQYAATFERFNEVDCLFVGAPDDDDTDGPEGEQGLDPGRPAVTGGPA